MSLAGLNPGITQSVLPASGSYGFVIYIVSKQYRQKVPAELWIAVIIEQKLQNQVFGY